jgi:hypothetical protein
MNFKKSALTALLVICGLGLAVNGYTQSSFTNGLMAYYLFNDPGNATVNDSSGNGNNGLIIGTDWQYSLDRFGNPDSSLFLNSTDPPNTSVGTYVAAPLSAAIDFNQNFTLSVWVNIPNGLPAYHVHNLISDGSDQTSANLRIVSDATTNGRDYLQFVGSPTSGGVDIHAFLAPIRDSWWQAIVVRSGTNFSLYRNGGLVAVTNSTATLLNLPEIWLGSMPLSTNEMQTSGEYPLDGGIDDVRMYNRALSASEVQQLYASEFGLTLGLVMAVKPSFSNLSIGTNYQLQVSSDFKTWTNHGSAFAATNVTMIYPQYFDVANWNQLFFRLQVVP